MSLTRGSALGAGAAALWALLCVRWFDAGSPLRPSWLAAVPPALLASPALALAALWLRGRREALRGPRVPGPRGGLLLVLFLAAFFRLPLAWQGAAGYTTPDGALSGIVAVQLGDGTAHHVFVPAVPYSGSLKSHLTAALACAMDTARAFALASVFFYMLFVGGVYRLGLLAGGGPAAIGAGLYVAFAPAFVTHYSLSNDGNYVEVLALGTWALVLAARWRAEETSRPTLALAAGLLLGLAFWCHVLAVIHVASVALALLLVGGRRALRSLPPLAGGLALGALPSLLWNAANGWASFQYLLPGGQKVGALEEGPGLLRRAVQMVTDHWPVLLGYDRGYAPAVDAVLKVLAWLAVGVAVLAVGRAVRAAKGPGAEVRRVLLVFTALNLLVALLALPHLPGNPRYVLFLMAPLPVFLAEALFHGARRWVLAGLVSLGALGSLAQAPGAFRADAQWRAFVAELERLGVRWCYADFHLATKINFLSEERIVCSAKLGPVTTEYFFEYRERVERAPEAALVAVNPTAAEKLERRLERLGVAYERRDLMKPVLLRLSRKVEPEELFPGREFPLR